MPESKLRSAAEIQRAADHLKEVLSVDDLPLLARRIITVALVALNWALGSEDGPLGFGLLIRDMDAADEARYSARKARVN